MPPIGDPCQERNIPWEYRGNGARMGSGWTDRAGGVRQDGDDNAPLTVLCGVLCGRAVNMNLTHIRNLMRILRSSANGPSGPGWPRGHGAQRPRGRGVSRARRGGRGCARAESGRAGAGAARHRRGVVVALSGRGPAGYVQHGYHGRGQDPPRTASTAGPWPSSAVARRTQPHGEPLRQNNPAAASFRNVCSRAGPRPDRDTQARPGCSSPGRGYLWPAKRPATATRSCSCS